MNNNGGSQVIPSLAFKFNIPKAHAARFPALYFTIDGMTATIGVYYARSSSATKTNLTDIADFICAKLEGITKPFGLYTSTIADSTYKKSFKPNEDKDKKGYSVYAPFCFVLEGAQKKEDVINDAVNIISRLFSADVLEEFNKKFN